MACWTLSVASTFRLQLRGLVGDFTAGLQARHAWVCKAIEDIAEVRGDLDASSIFPDHSPEERQQLVMQARRWLDAQPLSRRVLVKVSPADESAMRSQLPLCGFQ